MSSCIFYFSSYKFFTFCKSKGSLFNWELDTVGLFSLSGLEEDAGTYNRYAEVYYCCYSPWLMCKSSRTYATRLWRAVFELSKFSFGPATSGSFLFTAFCS